MARDAGEIVIDGRELRSSLIVTIRMPRLFGLRLWVAAKLVSLAGVVSGTRITVELDEEASEEERPS